jgi:hypothetical protein
MCFSLLCVSSAVQSVNFNITKMHGTIKIIDAQQAKLRNSYKNTKLKLLK